MGYRTTAALALVLLAGLGTPPVRADEGRARRDRGEVPSEGWAVGAPRAVDDPTSFVEVRGRSCVVRTTVGAEAARDVAAFVDRFLASFARIFKGEFLLPPPLTVLVLGHDAEFSACYERAYQRSAQSVRRALYAPHLRETWLTLAGDGPKKTLSVETAKHELTHHMLHLFTGQAPLPPWFDEGVACFFQYWDAQDGNRRNFEANLERARTGDFGYFPRVIAAAFEAGTVPTPADLLGRDYDRFHQVDADRERLHYSASWALVSFLVSTKKGQRFFNAVLRGLRAGRDLSQELPQRTLDSLHEAWLEDLSERIVPAAKEGDDEER